MSSYLIGFILVMALATLLTRALPFLVFRRGGEHPLTLYIGRYLPPAIMLLLVIYCLQDVNFVDAPHGLAEILASALVVGLHVLWRNALISIGGGTVLYVVLVQTEFLSQLFA